jgi:hypothetical protein
MATVQPDDEDERPEALSNIRDFLGWAIGCRVVDVTAGDPPQLPDADDDDAHRVMLHFDNGGVIEIPIGEAGFCYCNPDDEADDESRDE